MLPVYSLYPYKFVYVLNIQICPMVIYYKTLIRYRKRKEMILCLKTGVGGVKGVTL